MSALPPSNSPQPLQEKRSANAERALITIAAIVITLVASDLYRSITGGPDMSARLSIIETRLNGIDQSLVERTDIFNTHLATLQKQIDGRMDVVGRQLERINTTLDSHRETEIRRNRD